jgi:hypothetical protein
VSLDLPSSKDDAVTGILDAIQSLKESIERPGFVDLSTKRWQTRDEIQIYSGLGRGAIAELVRTGQLKPSRPVVGRVLFDRREVDAILESAKERKLSTHQGRGKYPRLKSS